jgi:hypothetical protein
VPATGAQSIRVVTSDSPRKVRGPARHSGNSRAPGFPQPAAWRKWLKETDYAAHRPDARHEPVSPYHYYFGFN